MRVLLILLGCLTCCADSPDAGGLRVFGAASLREVLDGPVPGVEGPRRVSTGGSNVVAMQLLAGAQADVFVSAGALEMQRLVDAGLVDDGDVQAVLLNQLVVVTPSKSQAGLADLGAARRVALAHPEAVPAGRYAKAWLESAGLWESVGERVVAGLDVRAAVAAVASGAVDFGIVYRSDAVNVDGVRVVHLVEDGPRIEYLAAPLLGAADFELAADFVGALGSQAPAWTTFLEQRGFGAGMVVQ